MEIRIPFYNILNMLLTGLLFIGGCILIFPEMFMMIIENNVIKNLGAGPEIILTICVFAVAYEIGLIINRIGSIAVEPILKKSKLIPFNNDYALYNRREKVFPKLKTLSLEYSLSRTGIALFLLLSGMSLYSKKWHLFCVFVFVSFVYFFSCRKHAAKIVALMSNEASGKEEGAQNDTRS